MYLVLERKMAGGKARAVVVVWAGAALGWWSGWWTVVRGNGERGEKES